MWQQTVGIRRPHSVSTQLCGASLLNTLHFTCLSNYITSTILVRKGEKRYKGGDKDLVATKVKKGSNSIKDYIHFQGFGSSVWFGLVLSFLNLFKLGLGWWLKLNHTDLGKTGYEASLGLIGLTKPVQEVVHFRFGNSQTGVGLTDLVWTRPNLLSRNRTVPI